MQYVVTETCLNSQKMYDFHMGGYLLIVYAGILNKTVCDIHGGESTHVTEAPLHSEPL